MLAQHRPDQLDQGPVALVRLAAAFEQDRVARAEREPGDLHDRVGPGLEHHAEDPERAADPLEQQAVVELAPQGHGPEQVGLGRERAQAVGQARELGGVEPEPRDEGRRQLPGGLGLAGAGEVARVGGEDRPDPGRILEGGGQATQQARARGWIEAGEGLARAPGRGRGRPGLFEDRGGHAQPASVSLRIRLSRVMSAS